MDTFVKVCLYMCLHMYEYVFGERAEDVYIHRYPVRNDLLHTEHSLKILDGLGKNNGFVTILISLDC